MTDKLPPWITALADEDLHFVRRFVLASGSLKALAKEYGVSYPTLRSRLDRLIAKVHAAEQGVADTPLQRTVRLLVADGKLSAEAARELLLAHKASLETEETER
jgi:hypothetical protein